MSAVKQPCAECGAETKFQRYCKNCGCLVRYAPPVKTKPELEQPIKLRIRDALVAAGCMAKIHVTDNRNFKHTGLGDGTSDLICIVPPLGRALAIEVKRPKYSPSDVTPDQRCFLDAVRKFGGVSGIATNVAEALALVAEAKQSHRSDA